MTKEEIAADIKACVDKQVAEMEAEGPRPHPHRDEKTSLAYWFPLAQATGVPVPKTEIIVQTPETNHEMLRFLFRDTNDTAAFNDLVHLISMNAKRVAAPNNPFFLRTGHTSGKHHWKDTCCVTDWAKIGQHIWELVEFSECADICGLPTDVWVVREMLPTEPMFHAFHGRMPIVREFRFFVKDGGEYTLVHWQPYWPADAIEDHDPSRADWREVLTEASVPSRKEFELLVDASLKLNKAIPGYWSIDWLQTKDGKWFMTDMAEGEKSYKWEHGFKVE